MPNLKPVFTECPECGKNTLPDTAMTVVTCQNVACSIIADTTHKVVIGRWKDGKAVYTAPEGKLLMVSKEMGVEVIDKPNEGEVQIKMIDTKTGKPLQVGDILSQHVTIHLDLGELK